MHIFMMDFILKTILYPTGLAWRGERNEEGGRLRAFCKYFLSIEKWPCWDQSVMSILRECGDLAMHCICNVLSIYNAGPGIL